MYMSLAYSHNILDLKLKVNTPEDKFSICGLKAQLNVRSTARVTAEHEVHFMLL